MYIFILLINLILITRIQLKIISFSYFFTYLYNLMYLFYFKMDKFNCAKGYRSIKITKFCFNIKNVKMIVLYIVNIYRL